MYRSKPLLSQWLIVFPAYPPLAQNNPSINRDSSRRGLHLVLERVLWSVAGALRCSRFWLWLCSCMTDNLSPIRSRSWQRPEEKEEGEEDKEEVVGKQEEKR